MRGGDERSGSLFSYVDLETRVGENPPLRTIRAIVNEALSALAGEFSALYSPIGRPSIPPEKLLRAMLLQAFYGDWSERQLMERMEFALLFRFFVGLGVDDPVWDHSTFSKNRHGRFQESRLFEELFERIVRQCVEVGLVQGQHLSVDGSFVEANAAKKSRIPREQLGKRRSWANCGSTPPGEVGRWQASTLTTCPVLRSRVRC